MHYSLGCCSMHYSLGTSRMTTTSRLASVLLAVLWAGPSCGSGRSIEWSSPTAEPAVNRAGQPIIGGGMPIGNGETTALVFPVTDKPVAPPGAGSFAIAPGVSFLVSMATAMASDTSLFQLGLVTVCTSPDLFSNLTQFSQRLDLSTATVTVTTASSSGTAVVSVWVDASTNAIRATVNASAPVAISARVQSVHPPSRFTYGGGFSGPGPESRPDVFGPESDPYSVTISHRNWDDDIPAAFNYTLESQGLGHLAGQLQGSDRWRHRQFGMRLSGDGLTRTGSSKLSSAVPAKFFRLTASTHANQTASAAEWDRQIGALHASHRAGGVSEHLERWSRFWNRSHIVTSSANKSLGSDLDTLTLQYAVTRYVQAIQSGTWVPIKFNGQMMTANLPPETAKSGPSFRDWGANSWWQNTRLPYWSMAVSGDWDNLRSILDFYKQTLDFNRARTMAYFNHDGIYYTGTKTLFGAYAVGDYGPNASLRTGAGWPVYLESNGYIHYDYGGNGGGTEVSLMVLDHYEYTQDSRALLEYLPIVELTLEFFRQHYPNRTADGKLTVWPTQSLETYWCAYQLTNGSWTPPYFNGTVGDPNATSNCIVNDHPTVAALHVLLEKALALPPQLIADATREKWLAFRAILPEVPLTVENGLKVVSPYASYPVNSQLHNGETPELYSTHPFRYFTLGRSLLAGRDITPSLNCLRHPEIRKTCGNAQSNGTLIA